MDSVCPEIVKGLLLVGNSYKAIAAELKILYPHISRGLSERSIRRYVRENDLREQVDQCVQKAVEESVNEVHNLGLDWCVAIFGWADGVKVHGFLFWSHKARIGLEPSLQQLGRCGVSTLYHNYGLYCLQLYLLRRF